MIFTGGTIVLEDRLLVNGCVRVLSDRIQAVELAHSSLAKLSEVFVDLEEGYLVPGFVDLHVHGGAGADFMDGDEEAFRIICQAHLRHGTTSLLPTTTVARHDQLLTFLATCRRFQKIGTGGARILGAHFYGPYFAPEARGCHPLAPTRHPQPVDLSNTWPMPMLSSLRPWRPSCLAPRLSTDAVAEMAKNNSAQRPSDKSNCESAESQDLADKRFERREKEPGKDESCSRAI